MYDVWITLLPLNTSFQKYSQLGFFVCLVFFCVQPSIVITFTKEFSKEVTIEKDDYDTNFILLE